MTATITLADRRLPLPITDEDQLRDIITAVTAQTGQEFRVRRPSPDRRERATVFTTDRVVGIEAYDVDLLAYQSPMTYRTEQVAA